MVRTGVPSTRFPTLKKGAGATDHCSDLSVCNTVTMLVATIVLFVLAVTVKGDMPMVAAFAVNLASHFAIVVGSRVEAIAGIVT